MAEKALSYIPQGMNNVTANLWFNGNCADAIEYYKSTFGAEMMFPAYLFPGSDKIMHAMIKIGDTNLMMGDTYPGSEEKGADTGTSVSFFVYVEDCDGYYNKALAAGCEIIDEMMDAFWGDRMGKVKDPFGHVWAFATSRWILSEDEMKQREKEWLDSMGV